MISSTAGASVRANFRAILRSAAFATLGLALAVQPSRAFAADAPTTPDFEGHLAALAPSVVSLKYLAVYDGSTEFPATCRGVVIDPTGLVLLSNDNFGEGTVKIRDVKVLLGSDPKEWGAVIVARDKTLDLAYVQILELDGKALPAVNLESGHDPKVGENLFGVTRAGRGFDYAPALRRLYVTSRIDSPRLFWDFSGEFGEAGLPAFDLTGKPVGVLVNQQSAEGSDEDGGNHQDIFVLPLAAVSKSIAQAKKRVAECVAKAKEAAKEPEAPKAPAMDGVGAGDAPKAPDSPKAPDEPKIPDAPKGPDAPKSPEPVAPGAGK